MTLMRSCAERFVASTYCRCSGASSVSARRLIMPSTPFIGVRISCDIVARKSLFARAPLSACSFAATSASAALFSAVTSRTSRVNAREPRTENSDHSTSAANVLPSLRIARAPARSPARNARMSPPQGVAVVRSVSTDAPRRSAVGRPKSRAAAALARVTNPRSSTRSRPAGDVSTIARNVSSRARRSSSARSRCCRPAREVRMARQVPIAISKLPIASVQNQRSSRKGSVIASSRSGGLRLSPGPDRRQTAGLWPAHREGPPRRAPRAAGP